MLQQCLAKPPIFIPSRYGLGQKQINNVEAVPHTAIGIRVLDSVDSVHPTVWKYRCFRTNTLSVVPVKCMKGGALPNDAINPIRQMRRVERVDVRLSRNPEQLLRMRNRAEQGLASYDDELVLVCDVRTGPDDVFEVLTIHGDVVLLG
jgi:hypothetical protein